MFKFLLLFSLISASFWNSFYPERVKRFGCRVEIVNMSSLGDRWVADAWAQRDEAVKDWNMTLGAFETTSKGRKQAEKLCDEWVDVAEKKIHDAQTEKPTK